MEWSYRFAYWKEADYETGDSHRRDSPECHFHCPTAKADSSGKRHCKWCNHSHLVKHLRMYYPCSAGFHVVAWESKIGRAEDHSGKEEMKKCRACLKGLEIKTAVGRREICPFCGSDLHCCLNCVHYNIGAYNDCREPPAERVIEKDRSNFFMISSLFEMPRWAIRERILESLQRQR